MKKSVVAIYNTHEKAVKAVRHLVKHDIPEDELSIVGQGEMVEDHIHFVPIKKAKMVIPYVGIAVGAVLGIAVGFGVVPIPGLKDMFGEGGMIGMLGGVVLGAVAGAVVSMIFSTVFRKDDLVMMQRHLDKGKYMLIVKGSLEDIEKSKKLLHTENIHEDIIDIQG